ncbi:MAG: histidinol-phosphatase, partial [Firmicutes bacterium]|nr:histidinol-phosphatase [Bacillota bacterium]
NIHTHTLYCDGKNSPEEMILDAISAGFDVLGFSGHCYTSFDEGYCMSREQTETYHTEIRQLAEKYKDRLQILCGIEQDRYGNDSAADFDYAIGSVHAFFKPCEALPEKYPGGIIAVDGGCYIYVDWTAEAMEWAVKNLYNGDSLALAEDYYETLASFSGDPDVQIIGHLDLLTKFEEKLTADGKQPLFDTEHPRYIQAANKAIEVLSSAGKIFEINTGAMAKDYRSAPYPSLPLLRMIRDAGGRIMINSDCHAAGKLDCEFELAAKLALEAGFTHLSVPMPDGIINTLIKE